VRAEEDDLAARVPVQVVAQPEELGPRPARLWYETFREGGRIESFTCAK
jgi:hypothetical protein